MQVDRIANPKLVLLVGFRASAGYFEPVSGETKPPDLSITEQVCIPGTDELGFIEPTGLGQHRPSR